MITRSVPFCFVIRNPIEKRKRKKSSQYMWTPRDRMHQLNPSKYPNPEVFAVKSRMLASWHCDPISFGIRKLI